MARPKKNESPDTSQRINLTAGAIERLTCRTDTKAQAFLRDTEAPGLRVRVTNTGKKSFVFEGKLNRQTIRRTIGDVKSWTIEQARTEARRLAVLLDSGQDPRKLDREALAAEAAAQAQAAAQAVTVGEVWSAYIEARRPYWGEWHIDAHIRFSGAGGMPKKRGKGNIAPGILHPFMPLRLHELTPEIIQAWSEREGQTRPTQARLALRLLRAFLNWCNEHPTYAVITDGANPAKSRRVREPLGKPTAKDDALLKEQLPAWFGAVRGMTNSTHAAYLQALLLTGARTNELLGLRWEEVDMQWRGLTIRDKDASKGGMDGYRVIPLTPYVQHLLAALPRRSELVFTGASGAAITRMNKQHDRACAVAGIDGLTLHGLRRSFGSLAEWLELPTGVIAQIQGHKPSATAERHYRVRPLDLLRVHHEKLEAWILEQAGVQFDAHAEPGKLRVVGA